MVKGMDKKVIVKIVVVAVLAAGLGFFGGVKYQSKKSPSFKADFAQSGQAGGPRGPGGPGGRGGFRGGPGGDGMGFVSGDILSKDATGITVKLRGGGSRMVITSAATAAFKPAPITLDALNVGDAVMVTGKANADGSVTAESIQVRTGMPGATGQPPAPGAVTNTNAPAPATK
jgi:hypothetical protein